ncbi:MAG: hypothetical protein JW860_00215 [Sedimentisphaerales bacterium]|nr:hypothetical protein [Sedimentisphaerales bacterium]
MEKKPRQPNPARRNLINRQHIKTGLMVLILSCLVWVLADNKVTRQENVDVIIELPTGPDDLLVQYLDDQKQPIPDIRKSVKLTVEGPNEKILRVKDDYMNLIIPDIQKLGYIPEQGPTQDYSVLVTDLIGDRLYSKNRQSSLWVTASLPRTLQFRVTRLVLQTIPVQVLGPDGIKLTPEKIEPPQIQAYIPNGTSATAAVLLSDDQQRRAAQNLEEFEAVVEPYNRIINKKVKVKLSKEDNLITDTIRSPRLEIRNPYNIEGRFRVVIDDNSHWEEPIKCRGTSEAVSAYKQSKTHIFLEINEDDELDPSLKLRQLQYNLPLGYGQIEIINKKLTPISFHLEKIEP